MERTWNVVEVPAITDNQSFGHSSFLLADSNLSFDLSDYWTVYCLQFGRTQAQNSVFGFCLLWFTFGLWMFLKAVLSEGHGHSILISSFALHFASCLILCGLLLIKSLNFQKINIEKCCCCDKIFYWLLSKSEISLCSFCPFLSG